VSKRQNGGARPGAGGTVSTIKLSKPHARTLRVLLKLGGGHYSQESAARWVEAQIDAAWAAYDALICADAALAWEGEVLEQHPAVLRRRYRRRRAYTRKTTRLRPLD